MKIESRNRMTKDLSKEKCYPNNSMLMDFANLKDKNGVKIRFGDILTDNMGNLHTPVVEQASDEHILFFKPIDKLKKRIPMGCKSSYSNTLIVIGNVYENEDIQRLAIELISK